MEEMNLMIREMSCVVPLCCAILPRDPSSFVLTLKHGDSFLMYIMMGQMTCICSSSPDEGGHPRASVLCELF
uniref:Uncharacterized protein n=1 Tax=Oryza rufipogon TaxID=4529 RepID=A0A0E0R4R1_ORYRU